MDEIAVDFRALEDGEASQAQHDWGVAMGEVTVHSSTPPEFRIRQQ